MIRSFIRQHLRLLPIGLFAAACVGILYWGLYSNPPVWPDEAIFSDMARNLLQTGRTVSNLYRDFIPNADIRTFWYPPAYFLVLAGAYRLLGIGFAAGRLLSFAAAASTLTALFLLVRRVTRSGKAAAGSVAVLVLDVFFRAGAHIARMESLVLLFGVAGMWLYVTASDRRSSVLTVVAGVCFGMAFLTHPMGGVFLLSALITSLWDRKNGRIRTILLLCMPFMLLTAFWLLPQYKDANIMYVQYSEQALRKLYLAPYISIMRSFRIDGYVLVIVYAVASVTCGIRYAFAPHSQRGKRLLAWYALIAVPAVYAMKEMWYLPYLSLAGSIGTVVLLTDLPGNRREFGYVGAVLVGFFLLWPLSVDMRAAYLSPAEYAEYGRRVGQALPKGSGVILSAIPDPYFYLAEHRSDLNLREVPNTPYGQKIHADRYDRIFMSASYAVVSYYPNRPTESYLQTNTDAVIASDPQGKVSYTVVRLKPPERRTGFSSL